MLLVATAYAGKFNAKLSPGDDAPSWHALADYRDAKAVVLIFTCNHCPVAGSYLERLNAIQKDYESKGVRIVAINCDRAEAGNLAELKEFSQQHKLNFPYLADADQATARAYGVRVTPEIVLLDAQRKVAYLGAVDDNWSAPEQVSKRYLRDALDAVLAGRAPEMAETRARGCVVQYDE